MVVCLCYSAASLCSSIWLSLHHLFVTGVCLSNVCLSQFPPLIPSMSGATATHCLPQVSSVHCRCSMLQPHHTRASSLVTDGRCSVYMNVRESARMSKFTNDGLTPSHTTCFIAIHIILLFVVFPVVRMPAYASSLDV